MHFDPKNYKKYYDFNVLNNNYHMLNNNLLKKKFKKSRYTPKIGSKLSKMSNKNEQKLRKIVKKLVLNAF